MVGDSIGITFSNAKIYSAYAGADIAATGWSSSAVYVEGDTFDECGGHSASDTDSSYHIHVPPSCLLQQLGATETAHSPQIGWSLDGFPVYGPRGPGGTLMQTCTVTGGTYGVDVCLDDCGGHWNATFGDGYTYRYHVMGDYHTHTADCATPVDPLPSALYFPFTPMCFKGCCPSGLTCVGGSSVLETCPTNATQGGVGGGGRGLSLPTHTTILLTCASGSHNNPDALSARSSRSAHLPPNSLPLLSPRTLPSSSSQAGRTASS